MSSFTELGIVSLIELLIFSKFKVVIELRILVLFRIKNKKKITEIKNIIINV